MPNFTLRKLANLSPALFQFRGISTMAIDAAHAGDPKVAFLGDR